MLVKRKKVPTDDRFLSVFFVITRTFLLSILNFSTGTHKSSHKCHGILAMNQSTNKSRSIMRTTDFLPVKQVKLKQLLHGTSFHVYPYFDPRVCTQSSLFQSFGCFGAQNLKLLISLFVHTKEPSTLRSFRPIQDFSPS